MRYGESLHTLSVWGNVCVCVCASVRACVRVYMACVCTRDGRRSGDSLLVRGAMFISVNVNHCVKPRVKPLGSELFTDLIHILYIVLMIDKEVFIRSSLFPLGIQGLIPCDSIYLKGPLWPLGPWVWKGNSRTLIVWPALDLQKPSGDPPRESARVLTRKRGRGFHSSRWKKATTSRAMLLP